MKRITKKEIALVTLGVLLFCCPFFWLLHSESNKGEFSVFNLSRLTMGYRLLGWSWAVIGSCAFTFSLASIISCSKGNLDRSEWYHRLSTQGAIAILAMSLFFSSVLKSDAGLILNNMYAPYYNSGTINHFGGMIVYAGTATSLVTIVLNAIAFVLAESKRTSEHGAE